MPDIDPITREAFRRASRMQSGSSAANRSGAKSTPDRTPPTANQPETPRIDQDLPKEGDAKTSVGNGFGVLFKDKEQSLILLLIILLMGEDNDPSLLLALMYLLI